MKKVTTMDEVRREIDRLDREIVALLAERQYYVESAGHIKPSRDLVRDNARVEDVVAKARARANETGASPDLVETVYRTMVEWFIAHEFEVFDAAREKR